jgi:hypothetical protein
VAICYHWQVVKYTLNVILRPIIDEIRLFEFGRNLAIKGQTRTLYGTLGAIVADNLASHQMGRLTCAFANGFRRCKTCLGTDWEIQNVTMLKSLPPGKPGNRAQHLGLRPMN